jgi:hypothetical protein
VTGTEKAIPRQKMHGKVRLAGDSPNLDDMLTSRRDSGVPSYVHFSQ